MHANTSAGDKQHKSLENYSVSQKISTRCQMSRDNFQHQRNTSYNFTYNFFLSEMC